MPAVLAAQNATDILKNITIRPFTPADYSGFVEIDRLLRPDFGHSESEWERHDTNRPAHIRWARFTAEVSGKVVGHAGYGQPVDMYHPRKFWISEAVHPEWQGQGIGNALYNTVVEAVSVYDPLTFRASVQEDKARSVRFVENRGYVEEMREFESRLNIEAFDFAPFAQAQKRVHQQGIVIKTVRELAHDPNRDTKLYELDWAVTLDMPAPDTLTKPPYETFRKTTFESPNYLPDAWFVALDGEEYVGESQLWRSQGDDDLYTGSTGVLREYRRRGIALALKLRAIDYARSVGVHRVKTWNATTNRAMLSINEALGFAKEPAWVTYVKHLKPESEEA
jgi:GNAT superfamily N-acetyltransferase